MKYEFSEWAKEELEDSAAHYEKEKPGLGQEFLTEIEDAIQRISDFPEAWEEVVKNVRLCQIRRFPYGIAYFVKDGTIRVVAVMHLHRRPGYWKIRLKHMNP